MPGPEDVAALRARAATLQRLAHRLRTTPALELHLIAGPDTWDSPRATACRERLAHQVRQLHDAIEDLERLAHHYDRAAQELEIQISLWLAPPEIPRWGAP